MNFSITQGDLAPDFEPTLLDLDDQPIDLTAATSVTAVMQIDGQTIFSRPATITDAANGVVKITWIDGETDVYGLAEIKFIINWTTGGPQTVPSTGAYYISILPNTSAPRTLVSLGEFKIAMGLDPNVATDRDDAYMAALRQATAIIVAYTGRDFATNLVTEQRTFQYDGSGYLEVDDAADVTAVTYTVTGSDLLLDTTLWRAEPYGKSVLTHLVIPTYLGGPSPYMGFTRNLDVLYEEGRLVGLQPLVKVDATWGWPTVPDDVKRAAIITALSMSSTESDSSFESESIENYSYSKGPGGTHSVSETARDLLAPYIRINI